MVHGDDKGLVLPPNVACIQVRHIDKVILEIVSFHYYPPDFNVMTSGGQLDSIFSSVDTSEHCFAYDLYNSLYYVR